MENMLEYIFWASAYLVLLTVVYRLALKPRCGAEFARWFLVVGTAISLFLPLVNIPSGFSTALTDGLQIATPEYLLLPEFVIMASGEVRQAQESINNIVSSQWVLAAILIAVSALILIRNLWGLAVIAAKVLKNGTETNYGMPTVFLSDQTSPFSFFNLVFAPIELKNSPTLQYIITHEQGHYKNLHTLDLIFFEFMLILFWFNPAVWYLRRELKLQHEYAADNFVMKAKLNKTEYQHALLNVAFYKNYLPVVASFNFHSLKNRIAMMNSKKTRSLKRLIASVLTLAFTFTLAMVLQSFSSLTNAEQTDDSNIVESDLKVVDSSTQNPPPVPRVPTQIPEAEKPAEKEDPIFVAVDHSPSFPGGEEARLLFLQTHLRYPLEARNKGIQGTVFVSFVVEKDGAITNTEVVRGIGGGCDEEVLRILELMPKWNPGLHSGKPVRTQFRMPVRFVLNGDAPKQTTVDIVGAFMKRYADNPELGYFFEGRKIQTAEEFEKIMDSGGIVEIRTERVNEKGEVEIRVFAIQRANVNTGQE